MPRPRVIMSPMGAGRRRKWLPPREGKSARGAPAPRLLNATKYTDLTGRDQPWRPATQPRMLGSIAAQHRGFSRRTSSSLQIGLSGNRHAASDRA
jgi:hypothetical protein